MDNTWQKIKIWTKLSLIALVVLFLLLFTYKNYSYPVTVWFFRDHTMTVLELLAITFFVGVVVTLLARPTYRTLCQISELMRKEPPPVTPSAQPPVTTPPLTTTDQAGNP